MEIIEVQYICPFCQTRAFHPIPSDAINEDGSYRNGPELQHPCGKCGRFTLPLEYWSTPARLHPATWSTYSRCPNAWYCNPFDTYQADCEEGRVMTKCFYALHRRMDGLPGGKITTPWDRPERKTKSRSKRT